MIITPLVTATPELKLMLLRSLHGQVVREGLVWQLEPLGPSEQAFLIESPEPFAHLILAAGRYRVSVSWQGAVHPLGELTLATHTCTDVAYLLPETLRAGDDYFFEYEAAQWFACRSQERELQSAHGFATLPLRDPNQTPAGEQGIQLKSHPLLRDAVQFDGVPPDSRPEPSQNRVALQLTLAQRLAATPSFLPAPSLVR